MATLNLNGEQLRPRLSHKSPRDAILRVLIVLLTVILAGCNDVTLHWQEHADVNDELRVLVERTADGEKYSELGGPKAWKQSAMTVAMGSRTGQVAAATVEVIVTVPPMSTQVESAAVPLTAGLPALIWEISNTPAWGLPPPKSPMRM